MVFSSFVFLLAFLLLVLLIYYVCPGKVSKSGDTMTGALIAQNNTNYSVAQVRNIIISTSDPSGGNSGDIWIKYVE